MIKYKIDMLGKANIFVFDIVIVRAFLIYLTDMNHLANVKLQLFFFSIKAMMP